MKFYDEKELRLWIWTDLNLNPSSVLTIYMMMGDLAGTRVCIEFGSYFSHLTWSEVVWYWL